MLLFASPSLLPLRPARLRLLPLPSRRCPSPPRVLAAAQSPKKNSWGFTPPPIPTLEQQYASELSRLERKFGPDRHAPDEGDTPSNAPAFADKSSFVARWRRNLVSYAALRAALLGDTVFLGALGFALAWAVGSPGDARAYAAGVGASVVYLVLLGRAVDKVAEAARGGARGVDVMGPARQVVLAAAVVAMAKSGGGVGVLQVVAGFFTYKLALVLPLLTGRKDELSE